MRELPILFSAPMVRAIVPVDKAVVMTRRPLYVRGDAPLVPIEGQPA